MKTRNATSRRSSVATLSWLMSWPTREWSRTFGNICVGTPRRLDVVVDYGDASAYQRMNEAWGKITRHRQEHDRFASDALLYGTQGTRSYDLDGDDVAHFRLNGRPRED